MTTEEFRRAGQELIDWIDDYRKRVAGGEFPVMSRNRALLCKQAAAATV